MVDVMTAVTLTMMCTDRLADCGDMMALIFLDIVCDNNEFESCTLSDWKPV